MEPVCCLQSQPLVVRTYMKAIAAEECLYFIIDGHGVPVCVVRLDTVDVEMFVRNLILLISRFLKDREI